jgi:hypothetical protein
MEDLLIAAYPVSRGTKASNGGVDAAARFHSSIAGPVMMRNTLPPLASNDLLGRGALTFSDQCAEDSTDQTSDYARERQPPTAFLLFLERARMKVDSGIYECLDVSRR